MNYALRRDERYGVWGDERTGAAPPEAHGVVSASQPERR
jgi:hypothetical protein